MEWMSIDAYAELTGLETDAINDLIDREKLTVKVEKGEVYIDPSKGTQSVVPAQVESLSSNPQGDVLVGGKFVEKTIGTIINLHEKVLAAKDETIESIKDENGFLKEALASLQELYEEERRTIGTLTEQLKYSQQEAEFMRRKYKLMWGRVIEEYADSPDGGGKGKE